MNSLRSQLADEPVVHKFATRRRRGRTADLTQIEIYSNAIAKLEYLQSRPTDPGGIVKGDLFEYACALRPCSPPLAEPQVLLRQLGKAVC